MQNTHFDGFEYSPDELQKFILTADVFTISLKNGNIVHHSPEDVTLFQEWLIINKVENMRDDIL